VCSSVRYVLVVRWSQTDEDVTVILHAGRPLKQNDIEVVFNDDKVNVGLTGNVLLFYCFLPSIPVLLHFYRALAH